MSVFKILLLLASFVASGKSMACASFLADAENPKSGGSVKHFFSEKEEPRKLLIKNETKEVCVIQLQLMDIAPKIDGAFRYVKFSPGQELGRSLAPSLEILDENGIDLLWEEIRLAPNQVLETRVGILENSLKQGTYSAAIRAYFPDSPSSLLITELFYSKGLYRAPELIVKNLKYQADRDQVTYLLKGLGSFYSFVRFGLKMVDPVTGFEVSGTNNAQGHFVPFYGHIRNFWLPSSNDNRLIRAELRLRSLRKLFKRKYLEKYPEADINQLKSLLVVAPEYGIDTQSWQEHYYLQLPPQIIDVSNN